MHQNNNFQRQENSEFQKGFPRAGNEIHHTARGLQNQEREPEVPEDAKRAAAAAPIDLELGLDFGFENFQVFVNAPGGHTPKFAINQRQVGKYGQAERQQHCSDQVSPKEELHVSPSFRRNRASRRSICPRSVSWSYPSRWRTPWRISIWSSLGNVRPSFLALRRATEGAIAISPKNEEVESRLFCCNLRELRRRKGEGRRRSMAGNDRTSVGPFFLRNA